jgi:hypothetical protein
MDTIDEIEDLRAELRHSYLTNRERREAETRLTDLIRQRDQRDMEQERFD